MNGWQTYGMFNEMPGIGYQVMWRPKESLSILSSSYVGWDTPNEKKRLRFHTDNSAVVRYYHKPGGRFISKAAFSVTGDLGFENGAGVKPSTATAANRPSTLSAVCFTTGFGSAENNNWRLPSAVDISITRKIPGAIACRQCRTDAEPRRQFLKAGMPRPAFSSCRTSTSLWCGVRDPAYECALFLGP